MLFLAHRCVLLMYYACRQSQLVRHLCYNSAAGDVVQPHPSALSGSTLQLTQATSSRRWRRHLDLNGDGSISLAEMAALMGELGVDADDGNGGAEAAAELMAAVAQADLGRADGGIDFVTFLGFCRKACLRPTCPGSKPGDVPATKAWHAACRRSIVPRWSNCDLSVLLNTTDSA